MADAATIGGRRQDEVLLHDLLMYDVVDDYVARRAPPLAERIARIIQGDDR